MQASLFDSSIWVALTFPQHRFHSAAESVFSSYGLFNQAAFCRATEQSYLRLITNAGMVSSYQQSILTNRDAISFIDTFLKLESICFLDEPAGTRALWLELSDLPTASPKRWMDAYLAAFAISGKLRFVTADKDFRQFESAGLDLHLLTA